MKTLAKHTNAIVYAADRIQYYRLDKLNFQNWEGTIYMFFPTGFVLPNIHPPIEIIDVTSPLPENSGGCFGNMNNLLSKIQRGD